MPTRTLKILATLCTTFILALWLMQHGIEQITKIGRASCRERV